MIYDYFHKKKKYAETKKFQKRGQAGMKEKERKQNKLKKKKSMLGVCVFVSKTKRDSVLQIGESKNGVLIRMRGDSLYVSQIVDRIKKNDFLIKILRNRKMSSKSFQREDTDTQRL